MLGGLANIVPAGSAAAATAQQAERKVEQVAEAAEELAETAEALADRPDPRKRDDASPRVSARQQPVTTVDTYR